MDAAEEDVVIRPTNDPVTALGQPVERALVDPGLGLDLAGLEVHARRVTAASISQPSETSLTIVCRIAERIRFEPALPSPASSSPSRRITVGDIIDGTRRPAG